LSVVEPTEDTSVESARQSGARLNGSRRRRLSKDEVRDIARLYAETSTPASEIRERFGIGDSSLYRVVQRHGLTLRGRSASSTQSNTPRAQSSTTRGGPSTASKAQADVSPPRATAASIEVGARPRRHGRSSRGTTHRAPVTDAMTSRAEHAGSRIGGGRHRFQIRFRGESVFDAMDVRDALRQAESLGATEITAVVREG
jgi:transposase-like protein